MSAKPGLLFVSHRLLFPPDKGERIRGWALLRHLSAAYDIYLGCLADEPVPPGALETLKSRCAEVAVAPTPQPGSTTDPTHSRHESFVELGYPASLTEQGRDTGASRRAGL